MRLGRLVVGAKDLVNLRAVHGFELKGPLELLGSYGKGFAAVLVELAHFRTGYV